MTATDRAPMGLDRAEVLGAFEALHGKNNNWDEWVEFFTDDCVWTNSMLPEPIRGKTALREFARSWPTTLVNNPEWIAIDGDRVAFAWTEWRGEGGPALRGFSTFVYAGDGLFSSYEGMFDTAAIPPEWLVEPGS